MARTLLDLAALEDRRTVERAIDRAELLGLFDLAAVESVIARNGRRPGVGVLRALLESYGDPAITRSVAEERFLTLIRAADLPRPRVNGSIVLDGGAIVEPDFLWPEARLIVEIDGRTYHARRAAFERDRKRDRHLALAGFETRRYSARELTAEPDVVLAEIAAFLSRRPPASR